MYELYSKQFLVFFPKIKMENTVFQVYLRDLVRNLRYFFSNALIMSNIGHRKYIYLVQCNCTAKETNVYILVALLIYYHISYKILFFYVQFLLG